MTDDVEAALDRENPEAWIPEQEGDQITGTVIRYEDGIARDEHADICVIADKDGAERAVWLLGAVLKSQFGRLKPKPGERIGIRFLGKRPSTVKGHNAYSDFRVRVVRDESALPNFDALAGEAAFEADANPFPPDDGSEAA